MKIFDAKEKKGGGEEREKKDDQRYSITWCNFMEN